MGFLTDPTGALVPLDAWTTVGRHPRCTMHVDAARVSGEHAALAWADGGWTVRDLGSRNGTFVDGKVLDRGDRRTLTKGSRLGFGGSEPSWVLTEPGPPAPVAQDLGSDRLLVAEDEQLAVPSPEQPSFVIYADAQGGWLLEIEGGTRPVRSGDIVSAEGTRWRLLLPTAVASTVAVGLSLAAVQVARFDVSLDEEHVTVQLHHPAGVLALGARAHHYLLLTLARARLEDAKLVASEQGWLDVEDLQRMLRIDRMTLNVSVYRARKTWANAGVAGAGSLVEVRGTQRRITLEPARLQVVQGTQGGAE
jgi:hypothetical protein